MSAKYRAMERAITSRLVANGVHYEAIKDFEYEVEENGDETYKVFVSLGNGWIMLLSCYERCVRYCTDWIPIKSNRIAWACDALLNSDKEFSSDDLYGYAILNREPH